MASFGVPQDDISGVIGISIPTLRKHYAEVLRTAEVKANSMVAQSLFQKATGDGPQSVTAAIFWMKTRARWRETNHTEITGKDGGPIAVTDLSALTDEQLAALRPVLRAIAGESVGPSGESRH